MTSLYEIPLSGTSCSFETTIGGQTITLTFIYRSAPMAGWVMDIGDDEGNPLACGIPLVTGRNLLEPFAYLGFTNQSAFILSDGVPDAVPTFTNLGTGSHLYWTTEP